MREEYNLNCSALFLTHVHCIENVSAVYRNSTYYQIADSLRTGTGFIFLINLVITAPECCLEFSSCSRNIYSVE